jgi:hypothetical protein
MAGGQVAGAIGVSGGTPDQDNAVAEAGAQARPGGDPDQPTINRLPLRQDYGTDRLGVYCRRSQRLSPSRPG